MTLLILLVWYNHHKMYAVLHKTPPTCCKVHTNVVVFIHTLGFQCWLSEWGWLHRLGAGTRSQADQKHVGTPLPAHGPDMPRLRTQITRIGKPSSSGLTVVNNRRILTVEFNFCGWSSYAQLRKCSSKDRSLYLLKVAMLQEFTKFI